MLVSTECHKDQADGHGWRPTRFQGEQSSLKPAIFCHKILRQQNCCKDLLEGILFVSPGLASRLGHLMD